MMKKNKNITKTDISNKYKIFRVGRPRRYLALIARSPDNDDRTNKLEEAGAIKRAKKRADTAMGFATPLGSTTADGGAVDNRGVQFSGDERKTAEIKFGGGLIQLQHSDKAKWGSN